MGLAGKVRGGVYAVNAGLNTRRKGGGGRTFTQYIIHLAWFYTFLIIMN